MSFCTHIAGEAPSQSGELAGLFPAVKTGGAGRRGRWPAFVFIRIYIPRPGWSRTSRRFLSAQIDLLPAGLRNFASLARGKPPAFPSRFGRSLVSAGTVVQI